MDRELTSFGQEHFGEARLGDKRRGQRLVEVADRLAARPQGSLPDKIQSPPALKALYRLARRPEVTHPAVLQTHYRRTRARMARHQGTVLTFHDTTELDYTGKRSLHGELGYLGDGSGKRGLLCHNSLATTEQGEPLGLANQILHKRPQRDQSESRGQRRGRADRESRLWRGGRRAIGPTPQGALWVDVCDRGGDGFEFLDFEHANGGHYLVRSQSNRRCQRGHGRGGASVKLHDHLRSLPLRGQRQLQVPPRAASQRKPARAGRGAEVGVAWAAVTLRPPSPGQARGEHRQEPLRVWAVRVAERAPPAGEKEALEWLLLSNVAVSNRESAWQRVDWYELRWPVCEEYHKGQKTGCDIEKPQFTKLERLLPVVGVLSVVAWLLMRLRWLSRDPQRASQPASSEVPWEWLQRLSVWRTGRAQPGLSVGDFLLALARLGGHQNRRCDGPPGWQTLFKGWMKLHSSFELSPPDSS
jgi:Transposase DNA-binding